MFGNGAGIGKIRTIIMKVKMLLIPKDLIRALTGFFAAGRGTTGRRTCVPLIVTATTQAAGATT